MYIIKNGRVTISNTRKDIIEKVALILRSLGERVTITKVPIRKNSSSGIVGLKDVYQLCFNPSTEYPTKFKEKKN